MAEPLPAQGGSQASLGGVVTDLEGAPLPDVEVRALHEPTGAEAAVLTDGEGRFRISNLRPGGPYAVEARRIGLTAERLEGLRLVAGQHRRIDFRLGQRPVELEGVGVVISPRIRISPSRMGIDHLADRLQITRFPTVNRELLELAELSPLVHREEGGRVSVGGRNDRFNAFQIDGLSMADAAGFPRGDLPEVRRKPIPMEALDQYRIEASPFDVRESGFQGGLLQAVTRSGTNEWEGTAFSLARHETLLGSLEIDGFPSEPRSFRKLLTGFAVGGPLRRDRTHLFVAGEVEEQRHPPSGFHVGEADPFRLQVSPDSMGRIGEILESEYGSDAGTERSYGLTNPMANLFGRLDHRISDAHTLTYRHVLARSEEDLPVNRDPVGLYEFSSTGTRWTQSNMLNGLELVSRGAGGWGNRLLVQHQRLRERALPGSDLPQVEVRTTALFEDFFLARTVRLGAGAASHALELDQDLWEVRNEVSRTLGAHHLTAGVHLRHFRVRHLYLPNSRGTWFFDDLAGLEANRPGPPDGTGYEVLLLPDGVDDPSERFRSREVGLFLQDEWSAGPGLTLQFGIRAETTRLPRTPEENPAVETTFGEANTHMPDGLVLSPRVGVNWYGEPGGRTTQLRGGIGVFQGRIPFEWIASTYAFTGTRRLVRSCRNEQRGDLFPVPPLDPGGPVPRDCLAESVRTDHPPDVQMFAEDLNLPRDLKVALGVDRELPLGLYVSAEVLFSHALEQLHLRDLNLPDPVQRAGSVPPGTVPDAFGDRTRYGEPFESFGPPPRRSEDFGHVIRVENRSGDRAISLHAEVGGALGAGHRFQLGYAYKEAVTLQSLTSADAVSAFGRNPTSADLDESTRRPSPFQRPHTLTFSGWTSVSDPWGATEIGLRYRGMSGRPYSYVYEGDPNVDGFPGTGLAREVYNDLIYLPYSARPADMPEGNFLSRSLIRQLMAREPCLMEAEGSIVERGACRGPWTNRVDLKAVRRFSSPWGEVELSADLLNVLNLLSSDWGEVRDVRAAVPILRLVELPPETLGGPPGVLVAYAGPTERDETQLRPRLPYTIHAPESQWQAQVGIRFRFGGSASGGR